MSEGRKTLGEAKTPVAPPLWVLTDLIMAAESGNLHDPARDAIAEAEKAIQEGAKSTLTAAAAAAVLQAMGKDLDMLQASIDVRREALAA